MADACPPSYESHTYIPMCPMSQQDWEERALLKNCSAFPQTCKKPLEYHCLLNAYRNRSIEVCAPKTRLVQQYCPAYSLNGQRITDQYNCSTLILDCPKNQYFSTDILKYKGCLQEVHRSWPKSTTNSIPSLDESTIKTNSTDQTNSNTTFTPTVENSQNLYFLFLLLIPIAIFLGLYIWRKRRCFCWKRKTEYINRKREGHGKSDTGCCNMIRRLTCPRPDEENHTGNTEAKSADVLFTVNPTESSFRQYEHDTSFEGQEEKDEAKPFISEISKQPCFESLGTGKTEESGFEDTGNYACNKECSEGNEESVALRSKYEADTEAANSIFNSDISSSFPIEKEDFELSEKQQKNGKASVKSPEKETSEVRTDCQEALDVNKDTHVQDNKDLADTDKKTNLKCAKISQKNISLEGKCSKKNIQDRHDKNVTENEENLPKTYSHTQGIGCYSAFTSDVKKDEHSSDIEDEKHVKDTNLQEDIHNISRSFSSAFPGHETVDMATSTVSCAGQESAITNEEQLQCMLKKVLPSVIKDVFPNLDGHTRNETPHLKDNQSWTPAQQKEIRDIRDRIKKIEETQNEKEDEIRQLIDTISMLEAEKKALEENVTEIEKKLHELKSEQNDEIQKLKAKLKKTKKTLKKRDEEIAELKHTIEKKDELIIRLKEEVKGLKEKETDSDDTDYN